MNNSISQKNDSESYGILDADVLEVKFSLPSKFVIPALPGLARLGYEEGVPMLFSTRIDVADIRRTRLWMTRKGGKVRLTKARLENLHDWEVVAVLVR